MTIRESIIAAAENELESRSRRAELAFEQRRAEFLESRPELAELQARLNYIRICDDYLSMGAQVPAAVRSVAGERYAYLFGLDEAGLSHEREAAEAEYKKRAGTHAEAGAEGGRYYCPRCRDTGFVSAPDGEIVRCGCYGQLLRDEIVKASGLPAGSTSFDKIELTVYGSRRNAMGPFYCKTAWPSWTGPNEFKSQMVKKRQLVPCGLLEDPVLKAVK